MRTTRSYNFFKKSHGICTADKECRLKIQVNGSVYCGDAKGEYSDFCPWFSMKTAKLCSIEWTVGYSNWKALKAVFKNSKGASFMLPVILSEAAYVLGHPNDYNEDAKDIKAVIYTTDKKIAEMYGTKMEFYSYSFLRKEFEKELEEFNNGR